VANASNQTDLFSIPQSISELPELSLDYQHDIFTLEFAAMQLTSPQKNLYQYKLEGFDPEWVNTDWNDRRATYTNLDPGEYTFKVKGSNNDGSWSETVTSIQLTITPPFWLTWWFAAGVTVFLVLIIATVFIYRMRQIRKEERVKHRLLQSEVTSIRSQMNPHFIFNCLSSINKFILKNDTDAASDYLTRFSRLIRLGLTNSQLSLIPLSDEIEMLRLYLDMERLRFSESFSYNIIYENTIEPETIYIPPMLLQPFCENAIWHGLMHKEGQGRLDIMMSIQNGELRCIIADNGVGRDKAAELKSKSGTKQKSFGLKITTERLALFNNEKTIQSFYSTEDVLDEDENVAGTKVVLNIRFKNTASQSVKEII
jgi:sensor histidine kinase YesM